MLEAILEFLGELLLQLVIEILVELGLHTLSKASERVPQPWLSAFGYALFGALLGELSLLVFPASLMHGAWRILNLLVTPVVAGLVMCLIGHWRARRGQDLLRIDRFAYGYLFALALGLVRFSFAH